MNTEQRFFNDDKIKTKRMQKTILSVKQKMESVERPYKNRGWELALVSSGTINSIRNVVQAQRWRYIGIMATALNTLKDTLIIAGDSKPISPKGLSEHRKPVFARNVSQRYGIDIEQEK